MFRTRKARSSKPPVLSDAEGTRREAGFFFAARPGISDRLSVSLNFRCLSLACRVRCATFAHAATTSPSNSHDLRLPHRCIAAVAQARCGPARVRTARRAPARKRQAALLPHHHHRLILLHRGDRSPRSPEATRTPSGSSTRGRFVFGVRGGTTGSKRDCIALPKHPGIAGPRQGKPRRRMERAAPGCFGAGGKRMQSQMDWRFR